MSMIVEQLYIHPIKSLRSIPVQSATITPSGLQHDRTFMLIRILPDGTIKNLTIKETSELCLFQPRLSRDGKSISISFTPSPSSTPITIPLVPVPTANTPSHEINIFGTSATGHDMGATAALFFSTHLGYPTRLVYIGTGRRSTHPGLTPPGHQQHITFADAAPLLLTTRASLDDITVRHGSAFDVTKFRPNIFVTTPPGAAAYDEEFWAQVEVGSTVVLEMTFNTVRCQSLNVDYDTGKLAPPEAQIYKKMTKDRRINPMFPYRPCFGRYAFSSQFGAEIYVGDEIKVVKRNEKRDAPVG